LTSTGNIIDTSRVQPDPEFNGYYYDTATGQRCVPTQRSWLATAPVYASEQVAFSNIGIEVLYENGNEWGCLEETRDNMDSTFAPARSATLLFDANGMAQFEIGNTQINGEWSLFKQWGGNQFALQVRRDANTLLFNANPSYVDNQLTLYRSGVSRLVCDRVPGNYPFDQYGENANTYRQMWQSLLDGQAPLTVASSFNQPAPNNRFTKLNGDQLDGRTLQCAPVYSELHNNREFESIRSTLITEEIVVDIEFLGIETRGDRRQYRFGELGTWLESEHGEFWAGSRSDLEIFSYTDELSLIYYGVGTQPLASKAWACRDIGGPSNCVDLDGDGFGWNGFGTCDLE